MPGLSAVLSFLLTTAVTPIWRSTGTGKPGSAWRCRRFPEPVSDTTMTLTGVTDISPADAWAVGTSEVGYVQAVHWSGKAWTQVPLPSIGFYGHQYGLSCRQRTSATSAWAVGSIGAAALVLHWNGKAWSRITPPAGSDTYLTAVKAISLNNAWAVGTVSEAPLIMHWNGKKMGLVFRARRGRSRTRLRKISRQWQAAPPPISGWWAGRMKISPCSSTGMARTGVTRRTGDFPNPRCRLHPVRSGDDFRDQCVGWRLFGEMLRWNGKAWDQGTAALCSRDLRASGRDRR